MAGSLYRTMVGTDASMNDNKELRFVGAHRKTTILWVLLTAVFFAAALVVRSYEGAVSEIGDSALHFIALWTAFALMWITAVYCVYLVWGSVGAGSFPGPASKLPVRCRLSYGAVAIAYRIVMVLAAVCLFVFPILVLWYID